MEAGGKFLGRRQSSMETDEVGHARERRSVVWVGVLVEAGGGAGGRAMLRCDTLKAAGRQSHFASAEATWRSATLTWSSGRCCLWVILKMTSEPCGQSR